MNKAFYKGLAISLACVCVCFASCDKEKEIIKSDETLVYERLETFEKAYNDGDWEGFMESFSSKTRGQIEATFNVMSGLMGGLTGFSFDIADLFSLGIGTMSEGDVLTLQIESVSIIDENAIAVGEMGYTNPVETTVEDVYFELVKENGGWYIEDIKEGTYIPEDGGSVGYAIIAREDFIDERAWINYRKGEEIYAGFIDVSGNILYSEKLDQQKFINIGKGSAVVQTDKTCKLIDKKGKVKITIEGETELKYGGGYVWVYQNKSTLTTLSHMYGQFDYTGKWLVPMEDKGEEGLLNDFKYLGNDRVGWSRRSDTNSYAYDYIITNAGVTTKRITICIENKRPNCNVEFKNGVAYIADASYDSETRITITTEPENGEATTVKKKIEGDFILYATGKVVKIDKPKWYTDGKAVIEKEGYYQITDYTLKKPATVTLSKYPASMVTNITFSGDYGLLELYGVDEKHYFTLIDTNGNQLYEPIYCEDYNAWGETIYLYPNGNVVRYYKKEGYKCVDKAGNISNISLGGGERLCLTPTQDCLVKVNQNLHYSYYSFSGELLFAGVQEKN